MRALKITALVSLLTTLVAVVVLTASLAWLARSEQGSRWLLERGLELAPLTIEADGISGTLAEGLGVERLFIGLPVVELRFTAIEVSWSPASLLAGIVDINNARIAELDIAILEPETKGEPIDDLLFWLQIPLDIAIQSGQLDRLRIEKVEIDNIRVAGSIGHGRLAIETVGAQIAGVDLQASGELRIVAPMSFGQRRLAPVVVRFALMHPKLRVTLRLEDRATDIVAEGIDLAVRIAYPSDSSLVARPIASVPRYFCASPAYLARRGTPRAPRDLLQHDCLHYNVISEREEWTFGGTEGDETIVLKAVFCSNNGDVLAEAALHGLGIALLPDFIVADALADGRLVRILEGRERSPLTLSVLYPSRQHVPAKTRLFIDHMVSQFA